MDDADCMPSLWREHSDDLNALIDAELNGDLSAESLREYCLRARQDFLAGVRFLFNIFDTARFCSAGEIRIQALPTVGDWEAGFWLARSHRGRGQMQPLLDEVFETVFRLPAVRRMFWRCRTDDPASQTLALRCGFTRTEVSDLPLLPGGFDSFTCEGLRQQPLLVYHRERNPE